MVQKLKDSSLLDMVGDYSIFWEQRMENDGNGNPTYIGYSRKQNAATSAAEWFIVKLTYDGNDAPTRYQLPDNGVKFTYVWDDRATLFT